MSEGIFEPGEYIHITNPVLVELMNPLPLPRYSPLILDGGNMVKAANKVIVTDRLLKDNLHQFTEAEIHDQLKKDLKCRAVIIPEYPNELSGRTDRLIRFIDDNTVFINDTRNEPEKE